MRSFRIAWLILPLASLVLATGCQEGGRFFGQMDSFVENEGFLGPEMAADVQRFAVSESRKRGELHTGWQGDYQNNERQREILAMDVNNYLRRERECYPNIDVERQSIGTGGMTVKRGKANFPGQGE